MPRLTDRTTLNTLAIVMLAGTVAAGSACGPRRAGFWNKANQPETRPVAATQTDQVTRNSAYYSTTPTTGRTGLASNTSATIEQTLAAESSFTYGQNRSRPGQAEAERVPLDTVATATNTSFSNAGNQGRRTNATGPMPESGSEIPNHNGLQPTKAEAQPTPRVTSAPVPNRSQDLSAIIYASAMGAELPTEFASDDRVTRATLNVRQITASFAGADFDPTPTPDGRHIVFASTQHRPTADIYIKPINGSVVTRLTDDPGQDVMPAVSPDGRYIAYCSDRNGSWDIFVMPIEGGKAVQLTSDSAHDLHPSWSPDGNRIVFSRLGQQTGRWEMWVADVTAVSNAQFIGFGLFPQWAPVSGTGMNEADQIMFQRSRERGDRAFSVWTLDYNPNPGTAGRETEIATAPGSALINPSWSPDARFVTFAQVPYSQAWASGASARPERSVLWMMAANGTGKVKLTDGQSIDLMPTWSRNNEIFFVSNMGGSEHLWSMDLSPALRAAAVQIPGADSAFATVPANND
ncbi:MAG: DPP IV N-terminal domain-containing protein [Phycisphaerales bacterium]|nr:PD40 domain-containing protein [Planctomycetota bacterium]MCH8508511.1 DPP IV N-terminal domain-containing protein [Phycisphaerales bacterium]